MENALLYLVSRGLRVFVASTQGEPIAGEYGTIYAPPPFNFKTDALRTNGIQWIMLTEDIE